MVAFQQKCLCLSATGLKDRHVSIGLCSWDVRSGENKASLTRKAHNGEVYSVDFNRKSEFLLLSGGEDGDVNLWDIRNLSKKVNLSSYSCIALWDITMQ